MPGCGCQHRQVGFEESGMVVTDGEVGGCGGGDGCAQGLGNEDDA